MKHLAAALLATLCMAMAYGAEEVSYTGELLGGRVAIGGETTGWSLRYRTPDLIKTIELDLKPELRKDFKSGARVRVTGTVTEREYVERGKVPVLVVREIVAADN